MKCVICKNGTTRRGTVTVTLEQGGATQVTKSVPAQVCENCGEAYLDEVVTIALLDSIQNAARQGVQVDVREYIAA